MSEKNNAAKRLAERKAVLVANEAQEEQAKIVLANLILRKEKKSLLKSLIEAQKEFDEVSPQVKEMMVDQDLDILLSELWQVVGDRRHKPISKYDPYIGSDDIPDRYQFRPGIINLPLQKEKYGTEEDCLQIKFFPEKIIVIYYSGTSYSSRDRLGKNPMTMDKLKEGLIEFVAYVGVYGKESWGKKLCDALDLSDFSER